MSRKAGFDTETLVWIGAGIAGIYVLLQVIPQATPLSIYPEFAYTAQTTMAQTPKQIASTAAIPATSLFSTTQGQANMAILAQCAGSYPYCTQLMSDTQLGL